VKGLPSIGVVAELAGVSTATVSRVLNSSKPVNAQTRLRVEAVVAKLGYRPNVFGRCLARSKSHLVLVLGPDLSNPRHAQVVCGIESAATRHGYRVVLTGCTGETLGSPVFRLVDGVISLMRRGEGEVLEAGLASKPWVDCSERLSYRTVAAELREVLSHAGTSRDVEMAVEHYIQLVERRIVPSEKIIEACKQIYRDHQAAFDLIVTHGQTSALAAAFEMFVDGVRVGDDPHTPDLHRENVRADGVFFVFKAWQGPLTETLPEAAKGSWPSKCPVLLWFELRGSSLKLCLGLGPYKYRKDERARFLEALREQLKQLLPNEGVKKGTGAEFTRLLTKSRKVAEGLSVDDLLQELTELWHTANPVKLRDAVLAAVRSQPPQPAEVKGA